MSWNLPGKGLRKRKWNSSAWIPHQNKAFLPKKYTIHLIYTPLILQENQKCGILAMFLTHKPFLL
jgi:hypothetical protein